jgi:hypothetical protein
MHLKLTALLVPIALLTACGGSDPEPTGDPGPQIIDGVLLPDVADATFVDAVSNPFFPLPAGATWVYEATSDGSVERIEIEVLAEKRTIQGVSATQVRDTVTLDGVIVEDTTDWYAQDTTGNVWYLGEDTCEFENGQCATRVGAWEWGVDGALPGILMPGTPTVDGQPFFQEYYVGEAQDVGEVIAVGESVVVAAGSFEGCVKTRDTSALDPDLQEYKYYCSGVGLTRVEEPDATEELIESAGLE